MKWRRLGQIFDFHRSDFFEEFVGYAQSPQALVFKDCVRFYFSTRPPAENGKFVSVVQYVDMSKDFRTVLGRSRGTVVPLGKLGTFDEHGIFPFSVFRHKDAILGYSNGWNRRKSVSVDTAIGLAISHDEGRTFTKLGDGPVLGPSLKEPYLVCDPFVRVFDGIYHMWYLYGIGWKSNAPCEPPDRTYVIAHATSTNGINWQRQGRPIIAQSYPEECQALPTIIKLGSRYHMMFCHRHTFGFRSDATRAYRLGYAWSDDLLHWHRDDSLCGLDASFNAWDSNMVCYPHLFNCDGRIYLAYNGNNFGRDGFGLAELEEI